MFRNRKKSQGKRPDDHRDRDNSRVLDRYSDTDPSVVATTPPLRRESLPTQNFQYLKLTDGFNIVLTSDSEVSLTASSLHQSLSSPDPSSSPECTEKRMKSNSKERGGKRTKNKPVTDVVINDRKIDAQEEDVNLSSQTEHVNVDSISRTEIVSSNKKTSSNSLSQNVRGEPLSSDLAVISKASELRSEVDIPVKPSGDLSSETGPTDIFRIANEEPTAVLDGSHAVLLSYSGLAFDQESKQNDKQTERADDLTNKTRGPDRGREGQILGKESLGDKDQTRGESRRGTSNSPSQSSVISPLEEAATHGDKTHSLFYLNDSITATESELAPSAFTEGFNFDKELNETSEQHSACTASTVLNNGTELHKTKQKSDTTKTSFSQSRQTDVETEDSPVWRVQHPKGQSETGDSVIQAAEISHVHSATVRIGHVSSVDLGDIGQGFRNTVSEHEKEKTSNIEGDVSEIATRHTIEDMFRLTRHTLSSNGEPNEQPAVYRKLKDNEKAETTEDPSSALEAVHNRDPSTKPHHPTPDPHPHQTLSPHPPLPSHSPRPATRPTPRKRSSPQVYENWTINQAVTQTVDSIDDDDCDEADEVDSDSISPGSTLDRHSVRGSKDSSGLHVKEQHSIVGTEDGQRCEGQGTLAAAAATSHEQHREGEEVGREGEEERIRHEGEENREEEREEAVVELPCVPVVDEESAIYENTAVLPKPQHEGGSSAGTPDVPDGPPSTARLSPKMAAVRRHHDNHSLTSTSASEDDPKHNRSMSGDSSFDEGKEEGAEAGDQKPLAAAARDNMLKMRHLVVRGVLDTEKTYLAILELLLHYKRTLEASCRTSQPVLSEEDIGNVFSNLQELLDVHKKFVDGLQAKVDSWGPEKTVGDVFMFLVEKFPEFGSYAENYQTSVATIHRCSQDNHRFEDLAKQIVVTSTTREVTSLEDALFKPVQRLQRNTLVLYDLIKHTPKDHPDHETLQNALHLSQRNLENFGTSLVPHHSRGEQKGELLKSSFLVELVGVSRKLRYVFLFSDMLVCTKREQSDRGGEVTFDCKWFIPVNDLQLDTKFTYQDDMKFFKRDEIEDLKKKLRGVKTELKKELNKEENKDKQRPVTSLVPSRTVEKLQRKANELEGQLILASPRLPFKVWHDAGKAHTFLMTTDYERQEWRDLLSKPPNTAETEAVSRNAFGVQEMVNSVRGLPEINEIGSVLIETEDEAVYGTLNVTVHKLTGLTEPCDTYCCLEMDSYGHFFMKARTHISSSTSEPSWNADFELDLEGSQTLRVLCYRKGPDKKGDILLCRGALEITKSWRKGTFQEKIVTMNEYSLLLSVCYTATEKTLRRTPVRQSGTAVFGVQIRACATREGKTVPTIVTACVQEVEKRGLRETGIYRVSGVTSDVQRIKKHFDKSVKLGVSSLGDLEIHTVTSLLKLYLRELPDPVFTEASYPNFLDALKLTDKEGKERCMLSLFYNLPDINYYTAVYLLEHLLRISRFEAANKMSIHNLSTIFGPTLLAPAPEKMAVSVAELMSLGAEHCMKQSQVIHYYLGLLSRGASLRRSSAAAAAVVADVV